MKKRTKLCLENKNILFFKRLKIQIFLPVSKSFFRLAIWYQDEQIPLYTWRVIAKTVFLRRATTLTRALIGMSIVIIINGSISFIINGSMLFILKGSMSLIIIKGSMSVIISSGSINGLTSLIIIVNNRNSQDGSVPHVFIFSLLNCSTDLTNIAIRVNYSSSIASIPITGDLPSLPR